jgi:Ni/Co efflux regulator RcnB
MKTTAIVCAIAAASMGLSSLSFAQGRGHGNGNDNQRYEQRDGPQGRDDRRDDRRDNNNGRFENRGDNNGRHLGQNARGDRPYGARGPDFHRGGRIPAEYRSRQYVVNDWRGHRLSAPPRGQQWVQVGGDYVLVAIATGVILSLVLSQ